MANSDTTPDARILEAHYDECEECVRPDAFDDAPVEVLNFYLSEFDDDPGFDRFQDRYRGTYPSLGDFWEDFLSEVYSGELEEFERLAQALSIQICIPHDFDEIAVEQDFVFDDETGAVFWIH